MSAHAYKVGDRVQRTHDGREYTGTVESVGHSSGVWVVWDYEDTCPLWSWYTPHEVALLTPVLAVAPAPTDAPEVIPGPTPSQGWCAMCDTPAHVDGSRGCAAGCAPAAPSAHGRGNIPTAAGGRRTRTHHVGKGGQGARREVRVRHGGRSGGAVG